jgi:hypothetical protein
MEFCIISADSGPHLSDNSVRWFFGAYSVTRRNEDAKKG